MSRLLYIMLVSMILVACKGKTSSGEEKDSTALEEMRSKAKRSFQDSILVVTQQDLAKTDSALQIAIAEHQQLEKKVTSQPTSEAEGNRLTALRLKRDSLQIRFEVLCAKIRLIHIKQKQS